MPVFFRYADPVPQFAMFDRCMEPPPEQHDMRRENQIVPVLPREPFQHRKAHVPPRRQARIEVRVVQDRGAIVVEKTLAIRQVDEVEFWISNDGVTVGSYEVTFQHAITSFGTWQQDKIEMARDITKPDRPVPCPMRQVNQLQLFQPEMTFQQRRSRLRHDQGIKAGKQLQIFPKAGDTPEGNDLTGQYIDGFGNPADIDMDKFHIGDIAHYFRQMFNLCPAGCNDSNMPPIRAISEIMGAVCEI